MQTEKKSRHSSKKKRISKRKKKIHSFTKKEYNSNDGMMTTIWGPSTWHLLHSISFNYPYSPTQKEKKYYKDFILSFQNILPCGKCRINLINNFKKLPLENYHMETRETFSKYIFNLHEIVNEMLGKKSGLTYERVRNTYEQFRARCVKSSSDNDKNKNKNKNKNNNNNKNMNMNEKDERKVNEKGCVIPFYGEKNKCVLQIVPENKMCKTFI